MSDAPSNTEMKLCGKHGLTASSKASIGSKNGRCRKCGVEAVSRRRAKVKSMAVTYLGGKCQHCQGRYPNAVFELHHVDPEKKDFAIGSKGHCRSWSMVKDELDKCLMLCANCHRIEHLRIHRGAEE